MTQVYFHCSNSQDIFIDECGAAVSDLTEARDEATCRMRSLIMMASPEDWRDWILHVSDDLGDELFDVSFRSVLGRLH